MMPTFVVTGGKIVVNITFAAADDEKWHQCLWRLGFFVQDHEDNILENNIWVGQGLWMVSTQ